MSHSSKSPIAENKAIQEPGKASPLKTTVGKETPGKGIPEKSPATKMAKYPGADYEMSLYGMRERNPGETAGQWKEVIKTEDRIHDNHIAIRGNGTDVWPGEAKKDLPTTSYFDKRKQGEDYPSQYDRMFHTESGYNSRLRRDDRQHTVGLDIQAEERTRAVPVRSSTVYGRLVHCPLDDATSREHVRIDRVMKGFYMTCGTGIPTGASLRTHPQ